ncbi:hypothetical protein CAPTEDRAFT_186597 [Capitella teleta]|uniref:Uncharacterized protein n=1 Tax=Capitella teleta TaxID=283909 RepID=R7U3X7_CAPTE|nr:hypothetical protein CAPTEDRAFT_186597 [Capitella teleta]|eukprot:ELU01045.1 hypothetical protein CAPTEDRAFT_186597 [Capitella teleta]
MAMYWKWLFEDPFGEQGPSDDLVIRPLKTNTADQGSQRAEFRPREFPGQQQQQQHRQDHLTTLQFVHSLKVRKISTRECSDYVSLFLSYLESQVDKKTLNDNVTTKPGFKGRSLSNHNARSFEAPQPKSWPKTAGPKEFFNGIPVVSVRDTESGLSSAKSQVTQSYHSVDLNPNPVLPPISPSPAFENEENPVTPVNLPKLQLQPPTPQMPTMASEDAGLSAKSREPTFGAVQEEEDEPFGASKHIFGSTENLGSELSSHRSPHGLKGRALHGSSPRVVSSKLSAKMKGSEGDSLKGSVIYAPDGEIISVGGSIASRSPVPSKLADDQLTESAFSGVDEELDNLWDQKSTSSSLPAKSIHTSRASSKSAHKALTEDQMVKVLSEHARSIAASVLSRPGTGMNVIADAQEIIEQFASSPNAPIEEEQSPTIEEYKEILRETLTSVVSKVSGNPNIEIPKDAEVTEELIEALAQDKLSPEDIEVVSVGGRSIIRRKSVASTVSRMSEAKSQDSGGCEVVSPTKTVLSHHTLENQEEEEEEEEAEALLGDALSVHLHKVHSPPVGDMVSFGVVDYGRQGGGETKELIVVRPAEEKQKSPSIPPSLVKKTSVASSPTKSSRKFSVSSSEGGKSLKKRTSITSELSNKDGSPTKSNSLEDRNEFVVGKVPEPKAIEAIYAPIEEPPKPKEKKPRVPKVKSPAKKPVKAKGKGKKKAVEKPTVVEKVSSPVPPPAEVEVAPAVEEVVSEPPARSPSLPYLPKTPEEKEEEDIEFVIVRDEFSDTEEEEMADHVSVAPEEVSKAMSIRSSVGRPEEEEEDEKDEAANLKAISNKEARAAKRAAQAAKRREEVERKRKEREEALKREREEAERKDNLQRELEEERRRREEEKRMLRERMEEQERRQELEEAERERRAAAEAERQKRQKEEYQRKLEEMRRKQHQEEAMRKILEEQKRKEEELLRIEEAKKMEAMEEAERLAYEEKKREEQELKRQKQEEQRLRAEEEARMALEAAERLAQEMARQQAELERRLQFNRSLQLESTGLEHTQDITRAFVFSYYEFLQWLGLEVPDFDQIKQSMGY